MIERIAQAKVNWDLHILGKRPDGYHAIDTVMVNVGLADRLTFEPAETLSMTCTDPSLPCDESNLVIKAARALAQAGGVEAKARIHLEKKIPAGGGLGGGSADAAAALDGLNRLWSLDFSRERLSKLAATFGSDISYFLWGGWCRCRGRGEIVEPIPESAHWPSLRIFLILPKLHVPTPAVYRALGAACLDGKTYERPLTVVSSFINMKIRNFLDGKGFQGWPDNHLQAAACRAEAGLKPLQEFLEEQYAGRWQMSGSGAVHFVLAESGETPAELRGRLSRNQLGAADVVESWTAPPRSSS